MRSHVFMYVTWIMVITQFFLITEDIVRMFGTQIINTKKLREFDKFGLMVFGFKMNVQ